MPYYDSEDGLRYAVKDDGQSATLEEFFELYEQYVQTPEQVSALTIEDQTDSNIIVKDGPPCLQTLCTQRISEGGRNNGLFNIGVYLRKAYPDSWESEILIYNAKYLDPPLPLNEVNLVAKQLGKKDYAYKCKDAPICDYCNADVCKTRKFGIEAAVSGATIAKSTQVQLNATGLVYGCKRSAARARHGCLDESNCVSACLRGAVKLLCRSPHQRRPGNLESISY
jgi:hypothetical protein